MNKIRNHVTTLASAMASMVGVTSLVSQMREDVKAGRALSKSSVAEVMIKIEEIREGLESLDMEFPEYEGTYGELLTSLRASWLLATKQLKDLQLALTALVD